MVPVKVQDCIQCVVPYSKRGLHVEGEKLSFANPNATAAGRETEFNRESLVTRSLLAYWPVLADMGFVGFGDQLGTIRRSWCWVEEDLSDQTQSVQLPALEDAIVRLGFANPNMYRYSRVQSPDRSMAIEMDTVLLRTAEEASAATIEKGIQMAPTSQLRPAGLSVLVQTPELESATKATDSGLQEDVRSCPVADLSSQSCPSKTATSCLMRN